MMLGRLFQVLRTDKNNKGSVTGFQKKPGSEKKKLSNELKSQYYSDLGVPEGSDLKELRVAWKRGLNHYHKDLTSENLDHKKIATKMTRRLNEAYRALEKELF